MSNKSDLTLGLCLSDENIQVMKRFCDSVDFLKEASQSGASVSLQWPDDGIVPADHVAIADIMVAHAAKNPTPAQDAPASAAQTAPIVPQTPALNPAPMNAAPIASVPIPAPAAPMPSVNPTPAASPAAPYPGYAPGVQPQTAVPTTPNFTPAIPSMAPPVPAAAPVAPTAAPTYTLEQLTNAGANLAQAGKTPQLLGLLQQFRIPTVNSLPEAQYGAFAMALRGLGAQL